MERVDCIVVGQGLAGTALAWALLDRGLSVRVIDARTPVSASRVAAGLITPVLGRRLAPASGFAECAALARDHYRAVERATGGAFLIERDAVRVFQSASERDRFEARRVQLGGLTAPLDAPLPAAVRAAGGAIALRGAARLDTNAYLDASRACFVRRGVLVSARLDPRALTATADAVCAHAHGLVARRLVFCGGVADLDNPWLAPGALVPVKGEVLTVRIAALCETRTVHAAGGWLAPQRDPRVYRFGATYDHDDLTGAPTAAARAWLCERLARLVSAPFEILDQQAAVRPSGARRRPVFGRHAEAGTIAFLNGLGSRGALWAPWLARALIAHLWEGAEPDLPMCRPAGAAAS